MKTAKWTRQIIATNPLAQNSESLKTKKKVFSNNDTRNIRIDEDRTKFKTGSRLRICVDTFPLEYIRQCIEL